MLPVSYSLFCLSIFVLAYIWIRCPPLCDLKALVGSLKVNSGIFRIIHCIEWTSFFDDTCDNTKSEPYSSSKYCRSGRFLPAPEINDWFMVIFLWYSSSLLHRKTTGILKSVLLLHILLSCLLTYWILFPHIPFRSCQYNPIRNPDWYSV